MAYRSVVGKTCIEQTVEKSRFLAYVSHTAGEEEVRAFLSEVRAEYPLATHVCWAYIADKTGNEQRFSDDGEPQGTAGMPILNVLKAQKLFETTRLRADGRRAEIFCGKRRKRSFPRIRRTGAVYRSGKKERVRILLRPLKRRAVRQSYRKRGAGILCSVSDTSRVI